MNDHFLSLPRIILVIQNNNDTNNKKPIDNDPNQ